MLMDCLAAGRSISLPSLSTGASELAARTASAYAVVRKQFDTPIGKFEGIEVPLARIGGLTYLMNAARVVTAGAVDAGQKPSVVSAIVKAYTTEGMRVVLNDAMDILAGAAICRGPRNILARPYVAVPIGITVEGANILTRSMIIFGQGAIRCHPFALEEMKAVADRDLPRFDRAFFGHINFVMTNAVRALVLGVTDGCPASASLAGKLSCTAGQFTRLSADFALLADAAMATLGGELKRREKLSARLADALAWMYLGSATMKHFVDRGQPEDELPFARWALAHARYEVQTAMQGLLDNFPNRPVAWLLKQLVFPLGAPYRPPSDALGGAVARALQGDAALRDRLTADIYVPSAMEAGLGRLDAAFGKIQAAAGAEKKLKEALREKKLESKPAATRLERAKAAGILTAEDCGALEEAEAARKDCIQVDAFDPEVFRTLRG
jgi:acyl-CoA dehydrogenase